MCSGFRTLRYNLHSERLTFDLHSEQLTFNLHSVPLTFNLRSEQLIYPVQPQAVTQQHCRAMPTCASLRPTRIPQTHRGDLLTQAAGKRSSKPVALQNAPSIISSSSLALEDLPARSTSVSSLPPPSTLQGLPPPAEEEELCSDSQMLNRANEQVLALTKMTSSALEDLPPGDAQSTSPLDV